MLHSRADRAIIRRHRPPGASALLSCLILSAAAGCASVPLEEAHTLVSYDGLTSNNGKITKAKFKIEPNDLAAAKTIYIEPTRVSPNAGPSIKKPSESALIANVISRALCVGVSDRFQVVDRRGNADVVVHATVTRILPTNATMAGVSTATSLGASFVIPVPVPRLPVGLGGLAVEAEARTRDGKQVGAMVWAKGANAITTSARVSQVGDAYSLASSFGSDFSKMLVNGKTPYKGLPKFPSAQKIKSSLGGRPKYPACERFGRSPGIKDFAASQIGLPPSWTDKQPAVVGQWAP
ncbi:DUF3313 domain-containing protein [Rhizobium sp. CNPSo 3490]|uniref:DUF3313 domain-containing protein n=1 Tax=Rhizobium sp. CNPSo 3490 TaxID=3021407 RepID=UPI00254FC5BB|nr:DUF3313 domain-containing protein [Rhizobium sp. CNPSo 3490]MDK4733623.1 DUF3313 domain-containing protein [Rhizobium sp. CNPSo 3490]